MNGRASARAIEEYAKFVLRDLKASPLLRCQMRSGPIHIEREHRHCRPTRSGLSAVAGLGRGLERPGNRHRVAPSEYTRLEIQGIAVLGDALRPMLLLVRSGAIYPASLSVLRVQFVFGLQPVRRLVAVPPTGFFPDLIGPPSDVFVTD